MDTVLLMFVVLLVVFLAIVAMVYIIRPDALMDCDEMHPDVDMWMTFIFALIVALFTVAVVWLVCAYTGNGRTSRKL